MKIQIHAAIQGWQTREIELDDTWDDDAKAILENPDMENKEHVELIHSVLTDFGNEIEIDTWDKMEITLLD